MKNKNTVNVNVNDVEINDCFVCRELKSDTTTLYIDNDMIKSLSDKFSFEMTDFIKQKIKNTTNRVYIDYQNEFILKHHQNFGDFIKEAIEFQKSDIVYYNNSYSEIFNQVNCIKEGDLNPWDLNIEFYSTLSKLININTKLLIKKIDEHNPIIKETSVNNSYGLCARADKEMSSKQRKNAMGDAMNKVLMANQEKKKKTFLKKLQEYSLITSY